MKPRRQRIPARPRRWGDAGVTNVLDGHDESNGIYKDSANGLRAGRYEKDNAILTAVMTPNRAFNLTGPLHHGDDFCDNPPIASMDNNCGLAAGNKRRVLASTLRASYDFATPDGSFSQTNFTLVNGTDKIVSPFASVEFDFLPNLTGLVEGRNTRQTKTQDIVRNAFVANTVLPFGAAGTVSSDFDFSNCRASARDKINADAMAYASVGAQYEGRLSDGLGGFSRIDCRHESKRYSAPTQFSYWGARNVVNLNAGIRAGKYRITAFVRNASNDKTPDAATPNGLINGGVTPRVAYVPALRTYGVMATFDF